MSIKATRSIATILALLIIATACSPSRIANETAQADEDADYFACNVRSVVFLR